MADGQINLVLEQVTMRQPFTASTTRVVFGSRSPSSALEWLDALEPGERGVVQRDPDNRVVSIVYPDRTVEYWVDDVELHDE